MPSVDPARALVTEVQRFSLHDGPGIRTTLFFKGCALRCRWCQNPETQRLTNELVFSADACVGCGDCATRCVRKAVKVRRDKAQLSWARCDHCLSCVDACPSRALQPAAQPFEVDALVGEALADRPYFGSDGGVTLSGGEPLLHHAFLRRLLPPLRAHGVHLIVQTCGQWRWEDAADLFSHIDLVHFDLKAASPALHRALTGVDNARILANLRHLLELPDGPPVELRIPLIPGLNTAPQELSRLADLVVQLGQRSLTLLGYHRLWESKLPKLDTHQRPLGLRSPSQMELRGWAQLFEARGLQVTLPQ
jgi:glycyl-radical enzyme activating protein